MSIVITRPRKNRKSPPQPLDRHLSEIGELDGTVYINAGIDSTCCKKRTRTIHKLINGIVVSTVTPTMKSRDSDESNDELSPILSNNSTNDDRFEPINSTCCTHCGK